MREEQQTTVELAGVDRAAILMMTLGEQHAAELLRHMEPREVQRIGAAMAKISNVRHEEVESVLSEFCELARDQTSLGAASHDFVKNVLVRALGREKAGSLMDRILDGDNAQGVEALRWMDSRAIGHALRKEHPQVIAIVISHLETEQAAEVISLLPEELRYDVMQRVATLDDVPQSALAELNDLIEKEVVGRINAAAASRIGGTRKAAEILNMIDSDIEQSIIEQLRSMDEDLVAEIEDQMMVFENLVDADDRGMQTLLREIPTEHLLLALKGADEQVRSKVFRNMSSRAAQTLRDDLEVMRPVRLSEVETAQKDILAVAKRLAEAGDLMLSSGGAGDYV